MDPISSVASVIAIVQLSIQIFTISVRYQQRLLIRNYGLPVGLPVSLLLRDTATQYERIEKDILHGRDADALAFKQAITDECNMTAVAVSL